LVSLDDLKNTVTEHLRKELKIMEMILSLNENDAREFKDWYINQPLSKGIVGLYGLVGTRPNGDGKIKFHHNVNLEQRNEKQGG
jgi:hypothetical protein